MRLKRTGLSDTRTASILVIATAAAILCVAGPWGGRQGAIVRERRAMIPSPKNCVLANGISVTSIPTGDSSALPWLRRWLGDTDFSMIWLTSVDDAQFAQYAATFPEAIVAHGPPQLPTWGTDADH